MAEDMDKQQASKSNENGKPFDALTATPEETSLMVQGYRDGVGGKKLCQDTHPAYRHGYRVGRNDDKNVVEQFQRDLIKRMGGLHENKSNG